MIGQDDAFFPHELVRKSIVRSSELQVVTIVPDAEFGGYSNRLIKFDGADFVRVDIRNRQLVFLVITEQAAARLFPIDVF